MRTLQATQASFLDRVIAYLYHQTCRNYQVTINGGVSEKQN